MVQATSFSIVQRHPERQKLTGGEASSYTSLPYTSPVREVGNPPYTWTDYMYIHYRIPRSTSLSAYRYRFLTLIYPALLAMNSHTIYPGTDTQYRRLTLSSHTVYRQMLTGFIEFTYRIPGQMLTGFIGFIYRIPDRCSLGLSSYTIYRTAHWVY